MQRSSAAAPARRMSRTRGSTRASTVGLLGAALARRSRSPWPISACSSSLAPAHLDRLAVERGRPRRARRVNSSSRSGSSTTPTSAALGVLQRDADRPGREAVEVVGGAVERVHHPAPPARRRRCVRALLGQQAVVGALGQAGCPRSRASASRSASETMSVRVDLRSTPLRGPAEALQQQRAGARAPRARRARGRRPRLRAPGPPARRPRSPPTTTGHPEQEPEGLLLGAKRDSARDRAIRGCRSSCRRRSTSRRRSASRCPGTSTPRCSLAVKWPRKARIVANVQQREAHEDVRAVQAGEPVEDRCPGRCRRARSRCARTR